MSTKRKTDSHSRAANRAAAMMPRVSRADSERDSGFSDAGSEHMSAMDNTDSEDSSHPVAPKASSRLAVVGGSYPGLSRMIIMNNVLLKQPQDNPPALKPWSFSPTVEVVQPVVQQPQVVFLQPVVSRQASPASKETPSRHRRPKKYLPILKSYPKIAPHPGDSSSGRGTASSSSSSSSSPSGSERGSSLTSSQREHCPREKQKRSHCDGGNNSLSTTPSLPATASNASSLFQSRLAVPSTSASSSPTREGPSPVVSQAELTASLSVTQAITPVLRTVAQETGSSGESYGSESDADIKRKRFCNTYNILSKSGLLDIALRTKELHRQNRRTQSDLDQLKEHTNLFLQALCSGDPSLCVKLQARLQEEDMEKAAQTILAAD